MVKIISLDVHVSGVEGTTTKRKGVLGVNVIPRIFGHVFIYGLELVYYFLNCLN